LAQGKVGNRPSRRTWRGFSPATTRVCHGAMSALMGSAARSSFATPLYRQDKTQLLLPWEVQTWRAQPCDIQIDLTVFRCAESRSVQWSWNDKDNRSRRHKRVGRPSRTSGRENGREGSGRRQARLAKEVGCTHHCTAASLISTNTGWTDMSTVEHVLVDRSAGTRSQGRLL